MTARRVAVKLLDVGRKGKEGGERSSSLGKGKYFRGCSRLKLRSKKSLYIEKWEEGKKREERGGPESKEDIKTYAN